MENPRSRRIPTASVPFGFLGMLLLVILIEVQATRAEKDFKNPWFWEWSGKGRAATQEAVGCDLLCFGSSLMHHGIIPRIIEKQSGERTYNLGISGGQAATSYFLLRRALNAGAQPSAVMVDFFPLMLNQGPDKNKNRWPELLTPLECLELAWVARDSTFFGETMAGRALATYRDRDGIRKSVLAAFLGRSASQRFEAAVHWRNWKHNRGCEINPPCPGFQVGDLERWYRKAFPNPSLCHPFHAQYIRRFMNLATANGIRVFWLVPPIHPALQEKFTSKGTEALFDQLIARVQHKYPDVTVLDGRSAGYAADVFVDHGHLDRRGAAVLSEDVGKILRDVAVVQETVARTVPLPPYQARPPATPLEDLNDSRAIVLQAQNSVRR